MQLLLKILQERKMQANGAVERGRGLADGMTEREDERPPPGRLTAPMTVSCGATFPAAQGPTLCGGREAMSVAAGATG